VTVATYKWTLDRYHQAVAAAVFEDEAIELLKGELVLMAPEGEPHACRGDMTVEYLREKLGNRAQIREGKPITIPLNASEPEPDIAIVERRFWEYDEHHPYPENVFWLIEFSNTSLKKDLEVKSEIYAEAGIREYWVVNLKASELVVFRDPVEGQYQSKQTYRSGDISPVAFPTIILSIDILLGQNRWMPA
jgi:Uma2 family endonuclease